MLIWYQYQVLVYMVFIHTYIRTSLSAASEVSTIIDDAVRSASCVRPHLGSQQTVPSELLLS